MQPLASTPDLAARIHAQLRVEIVAGRLAPGVRLLQEDLAARLRVSRQPVLQALRMIEADGLAVPADRRGTLEVARPDPAALGDFYALRAEIDGLAAARTADRIAAGEIARLPLLLVTTGRRAARLRDLDGLIRADAAFHRALYAASGNRLLPAMIDAQWLHLERAMAMVLGSVLASDANHAALWEEHAAQFDAINAGDSADARELARAHAQAAGHALVQRLTMALRQ